MIRVLFLLFLPSVRKDTTKLATIESVVTFTLLFLVGKGNSFTLSRQFIQHADGLEVHHSLLTLAKRVQGKGLTKKLFKELYSRYQRIGARYLTVDANIDIGGYAWAKYGFQANNMQEILDVISMGNGSSDTKVKAQNFVRNYYQKK